MAQDAAQYRSGAEEPAPPPRSSAKKTFFRSDFFSSPHVLPGRKGGLKNDAVFASSDDTYAKKRSRAFVFCACEQNRPRE